MQRAGWGRNFVASARVAFALLAPAVAGCASPAQTPAPACISRDATIQESREAVLSSIERIGEMYGSLLKRMREVEGEIGRLPAEERQSRVIHFVIDAHLKIVGNSLLWMKETVVRLQARMAEADWDARKMRALAQVACAALETAEVALESGMRILESASSEISALGKE